MKKYNLLDLFSGCGGFSLGFKMAGYNILGGIDFEKDCIETFSKNFKNTINFHSDIKKITNKIIKENYMDTDVLVGGPPCQGFSMANMRQFHNDTDERNYYFKDFIRFVKVIRPKIAIIENVPRILSIQNGAIKRDIEQRLTKLGYSVTNSVLAASDYGVPQNRKRNFFIAVLSENSKGFDFDKLKKHDEITVQEAISDFYNLENKMDPKKLTLKPKSEYQKIMRRYSKDTLHNNEPRKFGPVVLKRLSYIKEGENWKSVPQKLFQTVRFNRHSNYLKRLNSQKPSVTLDTSQSGIIHPKYDRPLSTREGARIQSFPDNFIFHGSSTSQRRQVGNAVAPILAKNLAEELKKQILDK